MGLESDAGKALASMTYGLAMLHEDSFREAASIFESTSHAYKALGDSLGVAFCNLYRAQTSSYLGSIKESEEYAENAIAEFKLVNHHACVLDCMAIVADAKMHRGQMEEGLQQFKEAWNYASNNDWHEYDQAILINLGNAYSIVGDQPTALGYYSTALAITEDTKRSSSMLHLNMAAAYFDSNLFGEALQHYQEALVWFEVSGKKRLAGLVLGNIGTVCYSLGQYSQAAEYYERALLLANEIGDHKSMASVLCGLGHTEKDQQRYEKALEYYSIAYNSATERENWAYATIAAEGICDVYVKTKDGIKAKEWLEKWRALVNGDCKGTIAIERTEADLLIQDDKPDEALIHLFRALEFAGQLNAMLFQSEIHKVIRDVAYRMNDLQLYAKHNDEHIRLTNELKNNETILKLAIFDKELELQRERFESERMRSIEHNKQQLLQEQLSRTAFHLSAQVELVATLRSDLTSIIKGTFDPRDAISKINVRLADLPCEELDWIRFDREFAELLPTFVEALSKKHPELTRQEVRICQLARVGLKSVEIARILCSSERTVENIRYRLRKKLGLSQDQDLTQTLEGIR